MKCLAYKASENTKNANHKQEVTSSHALCLSNCNTVVAGLNQTNAKDNVLFIFVCL